VSYHASCYRPTAAARTSSSRPVRPLRGSHAHPAMIERAVEALSLPVGFSFFLFFFFLFFFFLFFFFFFLRGPVGRGPSGNDHRQIRLSRFEHRTITRDAAIPLCDGKQCSGAILSAMVPPALRRLDNERVDDVAPGVHGHVFRGAID